MPVYGSYSTVPGYVGKGGQVVTAAPLTNEDRERVSIARITSVICALAPAAFLATYTQLTMQEEEERRGVWMAVGSFAVISVCALGYVFRRTPAVMTTVVVNVGHPSVQEEKTPLTEDIV